MWQKIKPYVLIFSVSIAIPLAVGILSSLFTRENMMIYGEISTPPLSPPAIVFPIVWSVLYILMGVSSGLVFLNRDKNPEAAAKGSRYYGASLVLNFGWSIIFFNLGSFFFAFIWLIALLYTIIKTIISYFKVSPLAAYLQIPYALWVCFAGYLNAAIWLLNG